ncbi:MAG: hypothetical protein ABI599_12120 [Flavobacteriales bacterium]
MITTNLPQFVEQLNMLCNVRVHDTQDSIELTIAKPVDVQEVDDLVCDALFVDPITRTAEGTDWVIQLDKRSSLRGASDMSLVRKQGAMVYSLRPAA